MIAVCFCISSEIRGRESLKKITDSKLTLLFVCKIGSIQ